MDYKTTVKARVLLSTSQTIVPTTWTLVNLDTIDYDLDGNFDTTLHRFVAPISGYFLVIGSAGWTGTQNDKLYYMLLKRSGDPIAEGSIPAGLNGTTPDGPINIVSDVIPLQSGQYIDMWAYNSGTADATIGGISYNTFMSIHLLSKD